MSKLLHDVGEALYGPRWQTALAHDLGVSDRTMRRWATSTDDLPPGVWTDCHRLMIERAALLDDVLERLPLASAPEA